MQYVHHVSRIMKFSYVKQQLRTEVERGVKILLEVVIKAEVIVQCLTSVTRENTLEVVKAEVIAQ